MQEIGIREARRHLAAWVDQVAAGEEVVLLRHGRPVARLVPPRGEERRLPSLATLRAALGSGGTAPEPPPETPADRDGGGEETPRHETPRHDERRNEAP